MNQEPLTATEAMNTPQALEVRRLELEAQLRAQERHHRLELLRLLAPIYGRDVDDLVKAAKKAGEFIDGSDRKGDAGGNVGYGGVAELSVSDLPRYDKASMELAKQMLAGLRGDFKRSLMTMLASDGVLPVVAYPGCTSVGNARCASVFDALARRDYCAQAGQVLAQRQQPANDPKPYSGVIVGGGPCPATACG